MGYCRMNTRLALRVGRRRYSVPFQDHLTPVDDDLFNLGDFQHYKVKTTQLSFAETCRLQKPVVFTLRLHDPYLNLALEDYIYTNMPVSNDCNRLMFYVNSPCVVIGKNQNPWREVNLPLLENLKIPLVRRRSGGGTVVHDMGNVNYSFMATKEAFDRFKFARRIVDAVNALGHTRIKVNARGDLVTLADLKVLGSAYKLSKGRSYHHGTMLMNSNLDVLGRLLHRGDELGVVSSNAAVPSVKSPVANLGIDREDFISAVADVFEQEHTDNLENTSALEAKGHRFGITHDTELPEQIAATAKELRLWEWRFGNTFPFTHTLTHGSGLQIAMHVGRKARLEKFELQNSDCTHFELLAMMLEKRSIPYTGSSVAGFVTDDALSEWLGNSIDGTS